MDHLPPPITDLDYQVDVTLRELHYDATRARLRKAERAFAERGSLANLDELAAAEVANHKAWGALYDARVAAGALHTV